MRVSVIIPFLHNHPHLPECIASVRQNSGLDCEIILIDDGNDDPSYFEPFEAEGVRVLSAGRRMGPSHARNMGLDAATADYIMFVDSDDLITSSVLPLLEQASRAAPLETLDILVGERLDAPLSAGLVKKAAGQPISIETDPRIVRLKGFTAMLYRTDFIRHAGIRFDDSVAVSEDGVFLSHCFVAARKIFLAPVSFYDYRLRQASRSQETIAWPQVASTLDVLRKTADAYADYPMARTLFALTGFSRQMQFYVRRVFENLPPSDVAVYLGEFGDWTRETLSDGALRDACFRQYYINWAPETGDLLDAFLRREDIGAVTDMLSARLRKESRQAVAATPGANARPSKAPQEMTDGKKSGDKSSLFNRIRRFWASIPAGTAPADQVGLQDAGQGDLPCARRLLQQTDLAPVILPPDSKILRDPPRPPELRPPGYEEAFDYHTLFYDVFFEPGNRAIRFVGPALLNLQAHVESGTVSVIDPGNGRKVGVSARRIFTLKKVSVLLLLLDEAPGSAMVHLDFGTLGSFDVEVKANEADLFSGKRVAFTLFKYEPLSWLVDWATFNVRHHGATALLVYHNDCPHATTADIMAALSQVHGLETLVVGAWNFAYGPGQSGYPWDSDFCQISMFEQARYRFLPQAAGVLNSDIDELVITTDHRSIFEMLEASENGYLRFGGRWVSGDMRHENNVPIEDRRHRHFSCVSATVQDDLSNKWAVIPAATGGNCQWRIHGVSGIKNDKSLARQITMCHFRDINAMWKHKAMPPLEHPVPFPSLEEAFRRVGWRD